MPVNQDLIKKNVREIGRGVVIQFYVKPDSNRTTLVVEEDELVFYTDEPPVGGRANASLIKFLSKTLRVSPSKIRIVKGSRDRLKIVEVNDVTLDDVVKMLSEAAEPW
ncbi:MAG: DUF167 domain-containing protein [Desulfurococcales archaeon]|nr:DUF167 domain-containing protein [Desulfurococcales archaeon]